MKTIYRIYVSSPDNTQTREFMISGFQLTGCDTGRLAACVMVESTVNGCNGHLRNGKLQRWVTRQGFVLFNYHLIEISRLSY